MTNVSDSERLHANLAKFFLHSLGLTGGRASRRGFSGSPPGRGHDDLKSVFHFLCDHAIGGVVQENLAASAPEGGLFARLEAWRVEGGEDRGRAVMRARELFAEAARHALGLERREPGFSPDMLDSAWVIFRQWAYEGAARRSEYLLQRAAFQVQEFRASMRPATVPVAAPGAPGLVREPGPEGGGPGPADRAATVQAAGEPPLRAGRTGEGGADPASGQEQPASGPDEAPQTRPEPPAAEAAPETPAPQMVDTSALWNYLPWPDGPDRHEEFASCALAPAPGRSVFGARVRGKKHKHEGTNCDDWFEIDAVEEWTLMAVSDGAGSCAFSRVGSKAACRAAIASLHASLAGSPLPALEQDDLHMDEGRVFARRELEAVQQALHRAMRDAREAMGRAVADRAGDPAHEAILGRALTVRDLSATLLLAVHTPVTLGGRKMDLVLSCQVGDGMVAAVSQGLSLRLLATPDSGAYSGETEFLTSSRKLEDASLRLNTHVFIGALKVLMLMTDGVSDDYFPNDPGMKLLYADLCLNGVLPLPDPDGAKLQEALAARGKARGDLSFERDSLLCTRLPGEGQREQVLVRSIRPMARQAGLDPADVAALPELLAAFGEGEPMLQGIEALPAQDRLLVWLDSYAVRGSFDDRTMVVLFKEA